MDPMDRLAQRLAELFRERNTPPSTAVRLARVIGANPLRIKWGDSVILSEDKLVIPHKFRDGYEIQYQYMNNLGNMVDAVAVFKINLQPGDQVLIAPESRDLRRWIVLDKC